MVKKSWRGEDLESKCKGPDCWRDGDGAGVGEAQWERRGAAEVRWAGRGQGDRVSFPVQLFIRNSPFSLDYKLQKGRACICLVHLVPVCIPGPALCLSVIIIHPLSIIGTGCNISTPQLNCKQLHGSSLFLSFCSFITCWASFQGDLPRSLLCV